MPDTATDTDWRTEIRALCGGDDLGAMHRYTVERVWPYAMESYWFGDHLERTHIVEVRLDANPRGPDERGEGATPEEALAKAVISAHEATGGV